MHEQPERINGPITGFSRKLHCYQIASYFVFAILAFSYWFLTFCLSKTVLKIVGGTLEGIFMLIILISGYICTATDPSDTILIESVNARNNNVPYNPPSKEFFCNVDMTFVNESSKHCKRCNRCTEDFDHHCKWINNDVGSKNYKSFIALIMGVLAYLLIYLAMAVVLTVDYANDNSLTGNNIFLYDTSSQIKGAMICLWVILGLSLIFLVMDLNLVLFHLYLIRKGLTTFQYIVLTEERREYKKEMERARRIVGNDKNTRTCLDFVLCLKKKKKKARNANVPPTSSNLGTTQTNQRNIELNDIEAHHHHAEIQKYQSNHRDHPMDNGMNRIIRDEEEGYLKSSDQQTPKMNAYKITINEPGVDRTESGGLKPVNYAENKQDAQTGPQEILVTPKNREDASGSVDEFGDVTAMNNSRNKSALGKSLHFESVKAMEEKKHHDILDHETPTISIQVLDDNNINVLREREPKSNYIVRDISPDRDGKENMPN